MVKFISENGFGTMFRKGLAMIAVACTALFCASGDAPKFYGNGAAGTVIEINENSIANCPDSAFAEKALACIVRKITTFSNIQVVDRRVTLAPEDDENEKGGGKNFLVLLITPGSDADGNLVYTVDCRITNMARKTDIAGFIRKDIPAQEVESLQIFRVMSQYLLQSMHVILTPAARKEILSAE